MPVIEFNFKKLLHYLDFEITKEEFVELIPSLGADVERVEEEEMAVEFFPDRPDLYSVEGIGRAFRNFYKMRRFLGKRNSEIFFDEHIYNVKPSDIELRVDPNLKDIRPYIGCALIKGLEFDERDIQGLMNFQEKLHLTVGRKRKKVAIGIHDFDAVSPPFKYFGSPPNDRAFVPLGETKEMTLREILEKHEKGREYRHLVEDKPLFPLIEDKEGKVLSFPPIINSVTTTVTENTRNIFLDITGTHEETVMSVLAIVSTSFGEMGGEIYSLRLVDVHGREKMIPDLTPGKMEIEREYINKMLGRDFSEKEISFFLKGMGFGVEKIENGLMRVLIPAYRADILHPIDLVEDVAVACAYMSFSGTRPESMTYGKRLYPKLEKIRNYMSGIGFSEVMTLMLSSEDVLYNQMNISEPEEEIKIKNPITKEHTTLRTWLAPGLLTLLKNNRHRDLPQRIYELDYVFKGRTPVLCLEAVEISTTASFSDAKSYLKGVLKAMSESFLHGFDVEFVPVEHGSFIKGRVAEVKLVDKEDEKHSFGFFGEIHPLVLRNFSLEHPVCYFSLKLNFLAERGLLG